MRQILASSSACALLLLLSVVLAAPTDPPSSETALSASIESSPGSRWWLGSWWGYLNGEYGWISRDEASVRESGKNGWLSHWLSMGGEGVVTIIVSSHCCSIPFTCSLRIIVTNVTVLIDSYRTTLISPSPIAPQHFHPTSHPIPLYRPWAS